MRITILFLLSLTIVSCITADRKIIDNTINKKIDQINQCYITELVKKPGLKGMIDIQITIGGKGHVQKAELVENTFPDNAVGMCIADIIKKISFPENKQKKTTTVNWPIHFSSK